MCWSNVPRPPGQNRSRTNTRNWLATFCPSMERIIWHAAGITPSLKAKGRRHAASRFCNFPILRACNVGTTRPKTGPQLKSAEAAQNSGSLRSKGYRISVRTMGGSTAARLPDGSARSPKIHEAQTGALSFAAIASKSEFLHGLANSRQQVCRPSAIPAPLMLASVRNPHLPRPFCALRPGSRTLQRWADVRCDGRTPRRKPHVTGNQRS
jgi:hypothetical protein